MERNQAGAVARQLRILFGAGTATGLSDGELLNRFANRQGEAAEAAFECLVERYGTMVLRVCRGVLQNPHDAEDAFQATFLVLALRPDAVRNQDALGSWLFGVARRAANKAKVAGARRLAREKRKAEMSGATERERQGEAWSELHDEVERLPEKYRTPIVLCYFAGLTHEEAAGELRLPVGTVKVRLSRARERLRARLVRRGLAPAAVAGVLSGGVAFGAVPARLVELTIQNALRTVAGRAGLSATVATLVKGVLRVMFLSKLKASVAAMAAGLTLFLSAVLALSMVPVPARSGPPVDEARQAEKGEEGVGKTAVETVTKADFTRTKSFVGTVEPAASVDLRPRLSGYVKSLEADIGATVKQGQVLAVLDAPEVDLDLDRAAATVEQAEAKLAGAKALIDVGRARVEAEKSRLETATLARQRIESSLQYREKALKRMQALAEDKAIDQQKVDEAAESLEEAKNAVAEALGQVNTAKAAIAEATAELVATSADVRQAEANLRVAQTDFRKADLDRKSTRVISPIDGIVTGRGYHVGDYVRSPREGGAEPFCTIMRVDRMRVVVHVPDSIVASLDKGNAATAQLGGLRREGAVAQIGFTEDPQTGNVRTEIDLDNPDGTIRPGQTGVVRIRLRAEKDVLTIPTSAILRPVEPRSGGRPGIKDPSGLEAKCYRVVDGRAVVTGVKLGEASPDHSRVEVLDGLKEGDTVIVKPDSTIKDGQPVEVDSKEPSKPE